jgi:hypothetical protein
VIVSSLSFISLGYTSVYASKVPKTQGLHITVIGFFIVQCYNRLLSVYYSLILLYYLYLRNRKHFPFFYRVIETRVKVWEKREIAWNTSTKCECFHAISSFSQTFTSASINSIGTRKKCFLFPLLNSLLKTIEKINLLILIAFIQILIPP